MKPLLVYFKMSFNSNGVDNSKTKIEKQIYWYTPFFGPFRIFVQMAGGFLESRILTFNYSLPTRRALEFSLNRLCVRLQRLFMVPLHHIIDITWIFSKFFYMKSYPEDPASFGCISRRVLKRSSEVWVNTPISALGWRPYRYGDSGGRVSSIY